MNYNVIRNIISDTMLSEVIDKDKNIQIAIIEYTAKIYKNIENKLNINLKLDNSILHTGDTPECCINCDKYKNGDISICNCTKPYEETLSYLIGDKQ